MRGRRSSGWGSISIIDVNAKGAAPEGIPFFRLDRLVKRYRKVSPPGRLRLDILASLRQAGQMLQEGVSPPGRLRLDVLALVKT